MQNFNKFNNLYSLSKTLRFELIPIGKTLDNMRQNLGYDEALQTFFADQEIEDAYQTLKPLIDKIHEQFITECLESEESKDIKFSGYLEHYKNKKLNEKSIEIIEKQLRAKIGELYDYTAEKWKKEKFPQFKWKKGSKIANGSTILSCKDVLKIIKETHPQDGKIQKATDKISEGFFTYLTGFNKNRENYYKTDKESVASVATRIIHENLPKFCDNIIFFENRSEEYLKIFDFLKEKGRDLVNKEGELLTPISKDIFTTEYFNQCLSQRQIELYNQKVGNINLLINLYNQARLGDTGFKPLSLFKTLYKQIGCGKKKFFIDELTHLTQKEAQEARINEPEKNFYSLEERLKNFSQAGERFFSGDNDFGEIKNVPGLLLYLQNHENFSGIYWSKTAINTISNKYFSNWHDLAAKIFGNPSKNDEEDIKIPQVVELEDFFAVLDEVKDWRVSLFKESIMENEEKKKIIDTFDLPSKALLRLIIHDIVSHSQNFLNKSEVILSLEKYDTEIAKQEIKTWLDYALAVCQMLKYFQVRENKTKGKPLDPIVSQALDYILHSEEIDWFGWYDSVRNFLTKKHPDDVKKNKLKLNFENSTLAEGWDVNKETDNYCIILRNSNFKYFLAIIAKQGSEKGNNKIFQKTSDNPLYDVSDGDAWQKMEYKLLPGPNKMLPKCLLPKSNRKKYGASDEILKLYDSGSFKKNDTEFSIENLHRLIDFYKTALDRYDDWKCFSFSFKHTNEYVDISQFYSDVEKQGYKLDFVKVNKSALDKLIAVGKIYLFEIKNQDSNINKKNNHKNNLHTIYWESIFKSVENCPKLNGQAEIFYRKALSEDKLERIEKNGKKIIKNFRFSKEKLLFHVPITLNFSLKNENINKLVNENLSTFNDIHFLGIDRGEKHLAYYSLIDKYGNIKEQGTLNIPFVDKDGKQRKIKVEKRIIDKEGKERIEIVECNDYNELLAARAGDRDYARKNWQTIGTIKELKEGYISQVVRKIADLAVSNNAFIVLEDLNTGFKRGRQKIEKSVYQKLELALAKKLNFLVNKSAEYGEVGSTTKALQLTPPVKNFKEMEKDIKKEKQLGIILYARANYTSQTDPVTGWRKTIYLKKGSEKDIKKQIVTLFDDISFDKNDYCFTYTDHNTGKRWKLYSGKDGKSLDRFRSYKNLGKHDRIIKRVDVNKMLNVLFENFDKERSLLTQIVDENIQLKKIEDDILNPNKSSAWDSLRFAIDIIQQIRNTGTTEIDDDFILSPVRDEKGKHFDSRFTSGNLPSSGDSNGAFNIARKGVIMYEHIKRGDKKLYISDQEWDAWLAGEKTWEKHLLQKASDR